MVAGVSEIALVFSKFEFYILFIFFILCIFNSDNNAWDSQQYSQVMYSSQNSQMSSMDMFSQQKGSIPSKFDQYQRSQSQTTEV